MAEAKLGTQGRRAQRFQRVGEIPFTSERKMMSSLQADSHRAGKLAVVAKGAPDVLLGRCSHVLVDDVVEPLDETRRARVLADVERLSGEAYRTLAVAYLPLEVTAPPELDESLEQNLVYAGMVGIIDPPRPEAATAIAQARRAGIRVVIITGDHPRTAARIAQDLGLAERGAVAVTGAELDQLDEEQLRETVREHSVYARVTPRHKLSIVDALQADHQVVAMTGDGVNDAPALKSADIGIAMGQTGTEVTKEAAKMILADDNFATIMRAVREGRRHRIAGAERRLHVPDPRGLVPTGRDDPATVRAEENTNLTWLLCCRGGVTGAPVTAFHTRAVLSRLAVTMRRPSGLNAAWSTTWVGGRRRTAETAPPRAHPPHARAKPHGCDQAMTVRAERQDAPTDLDGSTNRFACDYLPHSDRVVGRLR